MFVPRDTEANYFRYSAHRNPDSTVIGIDLEPIRPPYKLPNCDFQTMDATEPWNFSEKFDLIHVRLVGELPAVDHLFKSIYDSLNPGGWVECTEWYLRLQSPDHSADGTALLRWNSLLRKRTFVLRIRYNEHMSLIPE
jgi:trans-aconitate methyltransferase